MRIRVTLLLVALFALFASACTATPTIIGESGAGDSAAGAPTADVALTDESGQLTEAAMQAAMATVTPVPTPTLDPLDDPWATTPDDDADTSARQAEPAPTPLPTPTPVDYVVELDEGSSTGPSAAATPSATATAARANIADNFAVGRCYRSAGHQAGAAVSCSASHQAEVVMIGQFWHGPDAEYPGGGVLNDLVNDECGPRANEIGLVNASGMSTRPYYPFPSHWAAGDRSYVCFVEFTNSRTSSLASIAASQQNERAIENQAREEAHQEANNERVADQQVLVGECTRDDGFTKVPCSGPHAYQAYARTNLASAGGVYPGESLMNEQSEEFCRREHKSAGLGGSIFAVWPNRWQWEDYGVHAVVCLVSK